MPPAAERISVASAPLELLTSEAAKPGLSRVLSEDISDLVEALDRSLDWFAKPSSQEKFPRAGVTHEWAWASVSVFRSLLLQSSDRRELERELRRSFDVYGTPGHDGKGTVLFTGYYAPTFLASRTRSSRFRYPLYRKPDDLVVDPADGSIQGRLVDGRIVPYPSRAEIEERRLLAGQELVWMEDALEAYLVHVQGSAALTLSDGRTIQVSYAGSNGHEYVSVARALAKDGKLAEDQLSLEAVRGYFDANPHDLTPYLQRNPRFIFFREEASTNWPAGSLGFKVTPFRSIATDKELFPPGTVVLVMTRGPDRRGRIRSVERLMVDQDAGGAIRSPGRADLYFGVGVEAERLAGQQYDEGRLYYLLLKPELLGEWSNPR